MDFSQWISRLHSSNRMCRLSVVIFILAFTLPGWTYGEPAMLRGPQIKAEVRSGDLMALESSELVNHTVATPNAPSGVGGNNNDTTNPSASSRSAKIFPVDWSSKVKSNSNSTRATKKWSPTTSPPPASSRYTEPFARATQIYSTAVPYIPDNAKAANSLDPSTKPLEIDPKTLTSLLLQHIGTSNRLAEIVKKLERHAALEKKMRQSKSINHQTTIAPQIYRRAQLNEYDESDPIDKQQSSKSVHVPFTQSQHFYPENGRHTYSIQFTPNTQPNQNNANSEDQHQQHVYRPVIEPQQASQRQQTAVSSSDPQINQVRKNSPPVIQKRIARIDPPNYDAKITPPRPNFGARVNNRNRPRQNNQRQPPQKQQEQSDSGEHASSHSGESSARSSEEFDFATPVPGYHDVFEDREPVPDNSPSFVIPKLDLKPESLQQKGCRTIVKEVQQFPADELKASGSEIFRSLGGRVRRDATPTPRRVTSIIMTKECHFPGDETSSATEERPKYYPQEKSTEPKGRSFYPHYKDDDDILKKVSSKTIESALPSYEYSSHDHHDTVPSPMYGLESSREGYQSSMQPGFDFDVDIPTYLKSSSSEDYRGYHYDDHHDSEMDNHKQGQGKGKNNGKSPGYVVKQVYPKGGGKDGGKKPKVYVTITSSDQPKSASANEGTRAKSDGEGKGRKKGGRPTPKTVNRSFAVFSRDDGNDKDPNNKEYSMSYSQGKFSSFAEDYDSDRDGH